MQQLPEGPDLAGQIAMLRGRLQALEAQLTGRRANRLSPRQVALTLSALTLLTLGGVIYGQGGGEALFVDPSGSVGIGTARPLGRLEIQAGADSGGESDPKALSFSWRNGGYRHWIRTRHNSNVTGLGNAIDFYVNNSSNADGSQGPGNGSAQVMTLDSGRVGIGRTAPDAALDVNGRIKDQTGFVVAVGAIVAYAGVQAPEGWLLCDGAAIPQDAKFNELRQVLGRNATPDLRGRTLIGAGQGPGLSARLMGQQGGEENHKLTIAEMPAHKHYGFGEAYTDWPLGLSGDGRRMGSRGGKDYDNYYYGTTDEGGGAAFNNMQPYAVVNYIIKY